MREKMSLLQSRSSLFRRSIFRRSIYPKLILLGIIIICGLFYFKYISQSSLINENIDNQQEVLLNNNNDENTKKILNSDNNKYERMIQLDIAKQVSKLGDNGKAVLLTGESKNIGAKQLASIALNEELSENLSYNRTSPDARNPLCKQQKFDHNSLPTASVVVIFYNEPYSVLLRTVHSIINTAHQRNLKEIILVDDCSTNVELLDKLDYYVDSRFPLGLVKIIRLKNRYVFTYINFYLFLKIFYIFLSFFFFSSNSNYTNFDFLCN